MRVKITNNKGFVVILVYLIAAVLLAIGIGFLSYVIYEQNSATQQKNLIQAFYLAEAAVDKALAKLPSDTSSENNVSLGNGEYSLNINTIASGKQWVVTGYGYIPDGTSPQVTKEVQAVVEKKELGDNFWDNAIYTAGNVEINGTSYNVDGDVIYAGDFDNQVNVTGDSTDDPSINPLVQLDFNSLWDIANSQGHVYTEGFDVDDLPDTFYYEEPSVDNPYGTPNVVYVETDLILRGNIGDVGGFFVVAGDVINIPDDEGWTEINGNGQIDGCIYTTGEFRVNGGGGEGINVDGGVWSGDEGVRINGSVNISYNLDYMNAIRYTLPMSTDVQVISWREILPGEN